MYVKSTAIICFSPTNTTRRILYAICKGMNLKGSRLIDLTFEAGRKINYEKVTEDLVIIGVPVYEETIPEIIMESLYKIKGNGQPIILVAVYGNVGYGMTLKDLDIWAGEANFITIGAGAFIGEHSFSNDSLGVARGRPNESDLEAARSFGADIINKVNSRVDFSKLEKLILPGHLPLMARILPKNSARLFTKEPIAQNAVCNACGICVKVCPSGAINAQSLRVDSKRCLRCFACVRRCPKKARQITFKKKWLVYKVLGHKTRIYKEPETFII